MNDPGALNRARWMRARKSLGAGGYGLRVEGKAAIIDLLGDLLHLAASMGWDGAELMEVAQGHYEVESAEAREAYQAARAAGATRAGWTGGAGEVQSKEGRRR